MKFILFSTLEQSDLLIKELMSTGLVSECIGSKVRADSIVGAEIILINWPYILSDNYISKQKNIFNIHNSILPKYRGRHAFTWAILHGEATLGFSLHSVSSEVDAGDIWAQIDFPLKVSEDVNDAFEHGYKILISWLPRIVCALSKGELKSFKQDDAAATYYRKRSDEDNWIPSFESSVVLRDFVRSVAPPYTKGAKLLDSRGRVCRVKKADVNELNTPKNNRIGLIHSFKNNVLSVCCKDGLIILHLVEEKFTPCFDIGTNLEVNNI